MKIPLGALVALALVAGIAALSAGAASAGAPRCAPEGYGLEQERVPHPDSPQESVKLTAGWLTGTEGRRACSLQTTIRVTIADSDGVQAHAHWTVRTVLRPWSSTVHTWVWRNWCKGGGDAAVTFTLPSGAHLEQNVSPPTCTDENAPTTLVDLGTGRKYVKRPADRIPPHILPKNSPPPLHYALIRVKNAWVVSDGYTLVAVYAGNRGNKPLLGRFAVIRQNLIFGIPYEPPDLIDVPKAGALEITGWPHGAAHETSAQRGRLTFTSSRGFEGVLDLHGDRVRITARP